jgi:hypothetical protein
VIWLRFSPFMYGIFSTSLSPYISIFIPLIPFSVGSFHTV